MNEETSCRLVCAYVRIYTLSDKDGNVFYVGYTTQNIEKRLGAHLAEAKYGPVSGNKRKNAHIAKLNFQVAATIVDMVLFSGSSWDHIAKKGRKLEKEWIIKYKALGYDLLNRHSITDIPPDTVGKVVSSQWTTTNEG